MLKYKHSKSLIGTETIEGFNFEAEIAKCGKGQKTPPGKFGEHSSLGKSGGDEPSRFLSEDGETLVYHLPLFLQKTSQVRMVLSIISNVKIYIYLIL